MVNRVDTYSHGLWLGSSLSQFAAQRRESVFFFKYSHGLIQILNICCSNSIGWVKYNYIYMYIIFFFIYIWFIYIVFEVRDKFIFWSQFKSLNYLFTKVSWYCWKIQNRVYSVCYLCHISSCGGSFCTRDPR